jgi:drug/metabolite transporter (DMT)-like permease
MFTMKSGFDIAGHGYIALTLLFTVYGQLVLKWQMSKVGPLPVAPFDKVGFLLEQMLHPWILSGFVAAFVASLGWMAAMTRFELSYAYPFMSLAFVIVVVFSSIFLGDIPSLRRLAGTLLVIGGLILIARG